MDEDELRDLIREHAELVVTSARGQTAHVITNAMLSSAPGGTGASLCGKKPTASGRWWGLSGDADNIRAYGLRYQNYKTTEMHLADSLQICDKCLVYALRRGWLH